MLKLIDINHFGLEKCKNRARKILFWPNMLKELEDMIKNCSTCLQLQENHSFKKLQLREVPNGLWEVLGVDLFYFQSKSFILIIDYFSKFVELTKLKNESAENVIAVLKSNFARYGIPSVYSTICV